MSCSNAWVFLAQMVKHCSATAEAMGSNPIEVPNFFRVYLQLLKVARIIIITIIIIIIVIIMRIFIPNNLSVLIKRTVIKTVR